MRDGSNIEKYLQLAASSEEILGMKEIKRNEGWYSKEWEDATNKKNKAYTRMTQRCRTRATIETYRQLRQEEKRIHGCPKRQFENSLVVEIKHFRLQNESIKLYQRTHHIGQAFMPRSNMCKDTNWAILMNRAQVLGRWVEHFKTLLKGEEAQNEEPSRQVEQGSECDLENCEPPTEEEMLKAIQKLNDNKYPGKDGIPAEVIKSAESALIHYLHELVVDVWKTEKKP